MTRTNCSTVKRINYIVKKIRLKWNEIHLFGFQSEDSCAIVPQACLLFADEEVEIISMTSAGFKPTTPRLDNQQVVGSNSADVTQIRQFHSILINFYHISWLLSTRLSHSMFMLRSYCSCRSKSVPV